jgi:hypothetical protein
MFPWGGVNDLNILQNGDLENKMMFLNVLFKRKKYNGFK